MNRRFFLARFFLARAFFTLALVAVLPPASSVAAEKTPSEVVEGFHQRLLEVMKEAKALGVSGRYDRLAPTIRQAFDLRRMTRVAIGGFWRFANAEQKTKLLEAFERLSITSYAAQFDGFSGQVFKTLGEKPGPQKTVLVATHIASGGKSPAKLTYVLIKGKGGWRIVDVLLDNTISQLAVRRSEYRGVLKSGGVEGLLNTLNKKTESLMAG